MVIRILIAITIILIVIDASCIFVGSKSDDIMEQYDAQKHLTKENENT